MPETDAPQSGPAAAGPGRPWRPWILFWVLHAALSIAAFLWHYTAAASRFDGRGVSAAVMSGSMLARDLLWFPLAEPLARLLSLPGVLGWLPVLLNSALWMLALALTRQGLRRSSQRAANGS